MPAWLATSLRLQPDGTVTVERRHLLAASAAGALARPSIGRAAEASVLRFIPQSDLGILDPVWTSAYVTRNHAMMVFDTLYGTDSSYRVSPQMLAGHTVADEGRTWGLVLRDGLSWHDGEKVLARDCVASIRRWAARDSFGQALLAATDDLSPVDDRTIRFRLRRPFPLLPAALGKTGSNICAMMPERLATTDPFKQITEVLGSGPFRYRAEERIEGARVVYERNPAYVPRPDGTPSFTAGPKVVHVDRVEWTVMPDSATAAAAMQAGEMDWWEAPDFDLLPLLRQNAGLTVAAAEPTGLMACLRMNHLYPPFDNPALRRAVLGAVRQADFMEAAAGDPGNWRAPAGVFCPDAPMANEAGMEALTAQRDWDRSKREVEASGYRGERTVVLIPSDFPMLKALGDVGAGMLKRIGLNVEVFYADWGTVLQLMAKAQPVSDGGWSLFHIYWSGLDQVDPAVHGYIRGNGAAASRGWPTSERLEALRNEWLAAPDLPSEKRIAAQIQQQVFVHVPYIPLGQILPSRVYQRNVTDVLAGYTLFWNVRKA